MSKSQRGIDVVSLTLGKSNQLSTLFVMRAAAVLPAYIVYPTYSAGLILINLF